ncbi:MAG: HD-GYP domain-containing protein (c-di-GMP phosphodiesterase class II) [Alteromonadaceae bacterium]|jgi:HD-GYP domain-containing protein (c-di-GMP phosphodiesterase class II)
MKTEQSAQNAVIKENPLEHLIAIGIELSSEKNTTKILEHILLSAKSITNADGGTIYSITKERTLKFETLLNDTLGMYLGGTTGKPIPFPTIPIHIDGQPNSKALVALAAATNTVVNIEDAYKVEEYDMTGARNMDEKIGYRTKSVLTIPMTNHEGELNGVMQLINARDSNGSVITFSKEKENLIRTLASLAAVSLTNRQLIDGMEELFKSITRLIAKAIDEKSPYTGGHCRRVPELTLMIADAVHETDNGPLADFTMTPEDRYELSIAGWLHDCGKIAIPEAVMDKATKLEMLFDRIELVDCRIELAKRDLKIATQQQIIDALKSGAHADVTQLEQHYEQQCSELDDDREFLRNANIGGEYMPPEAQQRVADIGKRYDVTIAGEAQPLLSEGEVYNLQIARGTLTEEERLIINHHMDITIDMLEALPFPKHLQNVPEYAGGHHEKMDGTGYPKGLTRDEMSVQARLMAIADIFEALTASDRPYKKTKKVSECLFIMGKMKLGHHIDPELFDVFVDKKVYQRFADEFLDESQIDEIDVSKIPGYVPFEARE